MTYDPLDTDADGTVEADVDNQSTTAEDLSTTKAGVWVYKDGKLEDIVLEEDHADIAAAFNSARTTHGFDNVGFHVPPKNWGAVTTTWNFTGSSSGLRTYLDLNGQMNAQTGGDVFFDFTNSHNGIDFDGNGLFVQGRPTDTPSACFFFARPGGGGAAALHRCWGGTYTGEWTAAPFYNIGSEANLFIGMHFENQLASGRTAVYMGENKDSLTSVHATASEGGMLQNKFYRCQARPNNAAPNGLTLSGGLNIRSFAFVDGNINYGTDEAILMDASTGGQLNGAFRFQGVRSEAGSTPDAWMRFAGPASGKNTVARVIAPDFEGTTSVTNVIEIESGVELNQSVFGHKMGLERTGFEGMLISSSETLNSIFYSEAGIGPITNSGGATLQDWEVWGDIANVPGIRGIIYDLANDRVEFQRQRRAIRLDYSFNDPKIFFEDDGATLGYDSSDSTFTFGGDLSDLFSPAFNVSYPYPMWQMKDTSGGGSVTFTDRQIQLREPGAASSTEESRTFDDINQIDPSVPGSVTLHISNITIDNNADARVYLLLSDTPDSIGGGQDDLGMVVQGTGRIRARTSDDGTTSNSGDTSQDNAYVNSLNTIKISWEGTTATAETDDGSTTVTVSDSGNYPSGENLFLKVGATDVDGSNARNVDFDIDSITIGS